MAAFFFVRRFSLDERGNPRLYPDENGVKHTRYKVRPCLVLATATHGDHTVLLCAPESSQVHKVHGDLEVVLTAEEAAKAMLNQSCVIRFSRCDLVAVLERDVRTKLGHVSDLSDCVRIAIGKAAKAIGCEI